MTANYVARRQQALQFGALRNQENIDELTALISFSEDPDELVALQNRLADAQRRAPMLSGELALLSAAPAAETTDAVAEAAMLAWLYGPPNVTVGALVIAVTSDPVALALGNDSTLTNEAAAAVLDVVRPQRPGPSTMPDIRDAAGTDEAVDDMVNVAVRLRLELPEAQRPALVRDIAVLLPIRLETLFELDGVVWTMLLRIVPDEASVRRDDPVPTPTEIGLLTTMWRDTFAAVITADRALPPADWLSANVSPTAWESFCSQVGPARAAWLTGQYPPTVEDGAITVDAPAVAHVAPPNRIAGFPDEIEIWCSFASDAPVLLATTEVDADALVFDVIGGRAAADGSLVEQSDRWWVSWEAAKNAGLGVEVTLPPGRSPTDITTLSAIGLSAENPAELFRAHVDAGEMAFVSLGAPTNTVNGAQAASLAHGAEDWREIAVRRMRGLVDSELGLALAGNADALPTIPQRGDTHGLDRMLVRALWPALWGHHLRDIWGWGEEADRLGNWAGSHLAPEGPLRPIRIADQPYALLPVSRMTHWNIADEDGEDAACEERMLEILLPLREAMAEVARARGTVVGASTERLLELLGLDASSLGYQYRLFVPAQLWAALYQVRTGTEADDFLGAVRQAMRPANDLFGREAARDYLATGAAAPLPMPLIVPNVWPNFFWGPGSSPPEAIMPVEEGMAKLLELMAGEDVLAFDMAHEMWGDVLPDSLLIRLLLHAGLLSAAGAVQEINGDTSPLLEPLIDHTFHGTRLRELAEAWAAGGPDDRPAGRVRRQYHEGIIRLMKVFDGAPRDGVVVAELERAFRATLDTATHRVDPWIVGMATRRLQILAAQPDTRFRLGVYGWVDGPIVGAPGPTTAGLLHAPSHAQALTAAIVRDKAITERMVDPGGRDLWSMQLESHSIRMAEELAEEVRIGSHLYEAVGRQVERILATADGVRTIRQQFPMHSAQVEVGRVCSGVEALTALLSGATPVALSAAQREQLVVVRDAIDAFGDLLVAEAVHQVVMGHADLAGAAMDAAAGLAGPPTLAFTETPLGGDGLSTAVISALHFVASATGDGSSPALIADASMAAAVASITGPATAWKWTSGAASVTLADLDLEPVDTLALSEGLLDDMARFRLPDAAPDEALRGTGPGFHARARALVRTLGTQPALASDIASASAGDPAVAALDVAMLTELRSRYSELRNEAQRTIDALSGAASGPALVAALRRALRWGVTPMVTRAEQDAMFGALFDGAAPADPAFLLSLAHRAADALSARLKAAPALDGREPIGRAIAELAAPEGHIAVLSRIGLGALTAITGLHTTPDQTLDDEWLPVVAAVRSQLSRVEAAQLEAVVHPGATTGFVAVSSAPGDHWQTIALAALGTARANAGGDPHESVPRFVAGYGLGDVWSAGPGATVAIGLIDSWSEAVPRARQTSTAAFGFNAPASRPPQAILLAVPPDISSTYGAPADTASLVKVVAETRTMAHARAVRAGDLGALLAAIPTTMWAGTPDTGMQMTGTTFT